MTTYVRTSSIYDHCAVRPGHVRRRTCLALIALIIAWNKMECTRDSDCPGSFWSDDRRLWLSEQKLAINIKGGLPDRVYKTIRLSWLSRSIINLFIFETTLYLAVTIKPLGGGNLIPKRFGKLCYGEADATKLDTQTLYFRVFFFLKHTTNAWHS